MRIGVLLSGCGFLDGSEVHESVLSLLAIDRAGLGVEAFCLAPNMEQLRVTNHLTREETDERRNVLVEAARIARGEIRDLAEVQEKAIDALVIPGGFGAALNLSTFGRDGADCEVHPEVRRLVEEVFAAKKPIVAICIAPATVAKILGVHAPTLTIGTDGFTAAAVEKTGAKHQRCFVDKCVVDEANRLITTPAYMLGKRITEVAAGIDEAIGALMKMLGVEGAV